MNYKYTNYKPEKCEICHKKDYRLYFDQITKLQPGTNKWLCNKCFKKANNTDRVKSNWDALGIAT